MTVRVLSGSVRVVRGMARALRVVLSVLLIVGLLALNVATLLVPAVYDALRTTVASVATALGADPDGRRTAAADAEADWGRTGGDADADLDPERRRLAAEADLEAERARVRALSADLDSERSARRLVEADLDVLRRQGDEAVDAIDGLSSRILRRASRSAARAPGVLIGSAVPFAGTAVDLAGTVLDLTDACAMARDMSDLRAEMGLAETAEAGPICAAVGNLPSLDDLMNPPEEVPCATVVAQLASEGLPLDPGSCTPPTRPGPTERPEAAPMSAPARPLDGR